MVLTDSATTGQVSISPISRWSRKREDIFHKKTTHIYMSNPQHPSHRISRGSMCHCHFSTSLCKSSSRPHHNGLTGQLCFILDMVSPSKSLWWLLYASESPHQSNNLALPSFHLSVLTSYELQPARSLSENAEVLTHLHNMIKYAKQGLLSHLCVWAYR